MIRSNIHEFEQATVRILQEKLRVTVLRISNLKVWFQIKLNILYHELNGCFCLNKVVFDSDGVYVLFTLFDRASFYGPVPIPDNDLQSLGIYWEIVNWLDLSLKMNLYLLDAVKALNTSFLNDQIQIEFKSYDDKDVSFYLMIYCM